MTRTIGQVISEYRKKKGISQIELAETLEKYDIHIKNAAVSSWEKDVNTPTAQQLLAICQILRIHDIYTEFIGPTSSNPLSMLNQEGKKKVEEYCNLLLLSDEYKQKDNIIPFKKTMPISVLPASAGEGQLLSDELFEMVECENVPEMADFGVYLNGDSMEPRFHDKQLVWIEKCELITSGEIGLFGYNGEAFCKMLKADSSGTFLVSLNPNYEPIRISNDSITVFGKVLS